MKRILTLTWIVLLTMGFSSCVFEDFDTGLNESTKSTEPSNVVTYEQAEQQVNDILDFMNSSGSTTRSFTDRHIVNGRKSVFGTTTPTRAGEESVDMSVYIFNFNDDQGFAIVSGDNRVGSILALSESGNLDEGAVIDNPGFVSFLQGLEEYYKEVVDSPFSENSQTRSSVPTYTRSSESYGGGISSTSYTDWANKRMYGTIIPAKWGQGTTNPTWKEYYRPYNDLTPYNYYAGCVTTAVAQIMYHHGHPAAYNGYSFNWTEMKKHIGSGYTKNPGAYNMIARLMQQLGLSNNLKVKYGENGSSAETENVARTFQNFGYEVFGIDFLYGPLTVFEYGEGNIKSEVNAGRPVYISACDIIEKKYILGIRVSTTYKGHAWVIDAVLEQTRNMKYYDYNGDLIKTLWDVDSRSLVHCNWGWDGWMNGFYISKAFNTKITGKGGLEIGDTRSGTEKNYQYRHRMIIGIEPSCL